jgi:hypothetical protein
MRLGRNDKLQSNTRICTKLTPSGSCIVATLFFVTLLWKSERITPSLLKWGLGSLLGLSKLQSSIAGVKTTRIEVFFISLEKLSKCRCQKWARIAHLDIYSTSYNKKKGRESNWQFDSRPLEVGNRPDPGGCRWSAVHRWKALDKGYNFAWDFIAIKGLQRKLCALKVARVLVVGILGLPLGSPGTKKPFGCGLRGEL